ncbi:MAG: S8/S53 family peptidase [Cyclonatronaceae bacterium]
MMLHKILQIFTAALMALFLATGAAAQNERVPSDTQRQHAADERLSVFSHDPALNSRFLHRDEAARLDLILQSGLVRYRLEQRGLQQGAQYRDDLPDGIYNDRTGGLVYPVIIYTDDAGSLRNAGIEVNTVMPGFVTARVGEHQLEDLIRIDGVTSAVAGELQLPQMDQSLYETRAHLLHAGYLNGTQYRGEGAIVVVLDTGVDWQHPNFRVPGDTTRSRILYLWDVTLEAGQGETTPGGDLDYGVEYNRTRIEAAFENPDLIRSRDTNGHGTHVLGSAAASGLYQGLAPDADIIVIRGGVNSFSLANIINGLSYASLKGRELGKPVVVNLSLGGRIGPRDGTRPDEEAIDELSKDPGFAVVTSAGNDGGRNLHRSGSISNNQPDTLTVRIPEYTPRTGTSNDQFIIDIWMEGTMPVTATLTNPADSTFEAVSMTNITFDENVEGTVYMYNGTTGNRTNILVWVYDAEEGSEPVSGDWILELSTSSQNVNFNAWLASFSVGSSAAAMLDANNDYTVTMPATSKDAITVGAYTVNRNFVNSIGNSLIFTAAVNGDIASFSSIGPSRDGRQKPEISAPGFVIKAALSRDQDTGSGNTVLYGDRHIVKNGTSMASPHVAGAVALLMGANPNLTAGEAKHLIISTADRDVFTGPVTTNAWGAGKLNVLSAMREMLNINTDTVTEFLSYHGTLLSPSAESKTLDGDNRYAIRFTPGLTGDVTGFQLHTYSSISSGGNLYFEVYSDNAGKPGTRLGERTTVSMSAVQPVIYNYFDISAAKVRVQAGTDYHIVLGTTNGGSLDFAIDNGSTSQLRSMYWDGTSWQFIFREAGTEILEIAAKVEITSGLLDGTAVPVPDDAELPRFIELQQNYPNPFNPATTIAYTIPEFADVTLTVYDILGRSVAVLVKEPKQQGTYTVEWDAASVASGVYIYRIEAGGQVLSRKMTLLK